LEHLRRRPAALAGRGLESAAIDHRQPATLIRDEACLRQREVILLDPVVRHQQPSREPLLDAANQRLREPGVSGTDGSGRGRTLTIAFSGAAGPGICNIHLNRFSADDLSDT